MMLMKLTTSLPCLAIFLKLSCKLNFFKYAFWKNFWKEDPSSANNSKSFFLNVTLLSHFRPHKYTSDYNSITISKSKENRNWNSLISGTMMSHKIFHHIILSFIYIKLDFERTLKLGYNHGYNEQIWTVLWCYNRVWLYYFRAVCVPDQTLKNTVPWKNQSWTNLKFKQKIDM